MRKLQRGKIMPGLEKEREKRGKEKKRVKRKRREKRRKKGKKWKCRSVVANSVSGLGGGGGFFVGAGGARARLSLLKKNAHH